MDKSNIIKHLMQIGQFSEMVGIPIETLRLLDEHGILKPYWKDEANGYRYYSPTQTTSAVMVLGFAAMNISLLALKGFADNRSPDDLLALLHTQTEKALEIRDYADAIVSSSRIHTDLLLDGINVIKKGKEKEINVKMCAKMKIILGKKNTHVAAEMFYRELAKFSISKTKPPLNLAFPTGGYFKSMKSFKSGPSQPKRFFSIDPRGGDVKEAGLYMVGYARGYYGDVGDLP